MFSVLRATAKGDVVLPGPVPVHQWTKPTQLVGRLCDKEAAHPSLPVRSFKKLEPESSADRRVVQTIARRFEIDPELRRYGAQHIIVSDEYTDTRLPGLGRPLLAQLAQEWRG